MKKKLFDAKIYLEGLRQTRVSGLFLLVAMVFGSALMPLSFYVDFLRSGYGYSNYVSDISEFAPLLGFFMFLGPILLTMQLFSFLNKRNGSDFYHALPCTRSCLLISFSLSIVTWLASTILMTVLVNGILYMLCPTVVTSWTFIPFSFLTYFCGSLLVLAVMLIAKSLTGTALSNIVVAGLIGFGPRLFLLIFLSVIFELVPILNMDSMGFFMNTAYNIPVHSVVESFLGYTETNDSVFLLSLISTLVLAAAYFGIALVLFQRRKSEIAHNSAPNKVIQHVIRCLITIPLTLLIPIEILLYDAIDLYQIIVILFIAAIIYFGYELLSTKKAKNLLQALPVFAVVILFDILFGVALYGTKEAYLAVPDISEIQAVSIGVENKDYGYEHYNLLLTEDHMFEDEDLIQIVWDSWTQTVEDVRNNQYSRKLYYDYDNAYYYSYPVSIQKENGSVVSRNLLFTFATLERIYAIHEADTGYQEKLVQLPAKNKIQQIEFANVSDQKAKDEIWEIFCEEYAALSYEEKLLTNGIGTFYVDTKWNDTSLDKINFSVYGYMGLTAYQVNYSLSAKTPRAYQAYIEAVNQENEAQVKLFWEEVKAMENGELERVEYDVYCTDYSGTADYAFNGFVGKGGLDLYYQATTHSREELKEVLSLLENAIGSSVDLNETLFSLQLSRTEWDEEKEGYLYGETVEVYFSLSEEEVEALKPYLNET